MRVREREGISAMVRIAVVGLGKMGLSHCAIVGGHPDAEVVACEQGSLVRDGLSRYTKIPMHKSYETMLAKEELDGVVIATPSKLHGDMVRKALDRGIHVFCEKPFCLDYREAEALADLAETKGLINQVGYHYRALETFREAKRIIDSGALGPVSHVLAEAYGPVVLRPKGVTWRTNASDGGGCLYDYAAHPINLVNWYFGVPERVGGSVLNGIFSTQTDDEVYSTLFYPKGLTAQIATNWSDESYRKMTTKLTFAGAKGRMTVDRLELQLYLREPNTALPEYQQGWNVKYVTDFPTELNYYLRGEEYSLQMDDFVTAIQTKQPRTNCTFRHAAETDRTMAMIKADATGGSVQSGAPGRAAAPGR